MEFKLGQRVRALKNPGLRDSDPAFLHKQPEGVVVEILDDGETLGVDWDEEWIPWRFIYAWGLEPIGDKTK
jgi:hypothetical protein